MRSDLGHRYTPFGGIEKVFELYKRGSITLSEVSDRVKVSKTTVSNDLKKVYGIDALEKARAMLKQASSLESRIKNINEGKAAELEYDQAILYLENGTLETNRCLNSLKTMAEIAEPFLGEPSLVWFTSRTICKIKGSKGCVKIRCANPKENTVEYKNSRYRFKIIPGHMKDYDAAVFCIFSNLASSFYLFPIHKLNSIQSLNLNFDDYGKSKYVDFLKRVEKAA